jgi:hypothetical protein
LQLAKVMGTRGRRQRDAARSLNDICPMMAPSAESSTAPPRGQPSPSSASAETAFRALLHRTRPLLAPTDGGAPALTGQGTAGAPPAVRGFDQ